MNNFTSHPRATGRNTSLGLGLFMRLLARGVVFSAADYSIGHKL